MPAPFAAAEARVNSAVFARLSNAIGLLNGVSVSGIFDQAYDQAGIGLSGMSSSRPVFSVLSSLVSSNVVGMPFVLNLTSYKVVESQPDGTGMTVLFLERAA